MIFKNWKKKEFNHKMFFEKEDTKKVSVKDFGEIIGKAITKSIGTILNIGGFIVIFSVIISILETGLKMPDNTLSAILSGLLELTNGISKLSAFGTSFLNIVLASFLLGFGGISVLLQVYSVIAESNLSIKPYLYGKILQAFFSAVITSVLLIILF